MKYVCLLARYDYALFGPKFMLSFYCLTMFLISYVIYNTYESFLLASTNLIFSGKMCIRYNIILISIVITPRNLTAVLLFPFRPTGTV